MLVRKGISQGKVRSISTLARSGNNVSLIYLEHFLIYLRVPNFLTQFLVSRYNTIIKKAFRKKFGAGLCIDQWNLYGSASGGHAPLLRSSTLKCKNLHDNFQPVNCFKLVQFFKFLAWNFNFQYFIMVCRWSIIIESWSKSSSDATIDYAFFITNCREKIKNLLATNKTIEINKNARLISWCKLSFPWTPNF